MHLNFMRPPDWMDQAACAGTIDDTLWFPARGTSVSPEAKAICKECPVATECITYAIQTRSEGVWGGTNTDLRQRQTTIVNRRACGVIGCDNLAPYARLYCGPEHRRVGQNLSMRATREDVA